MPHSSTPNTRMLMHQPSLLQLERLIVQKRTWQICAYRASPWAFSSMAVVVGVVAVPILTTALHLAKRAPWTQAWPGVSASWQGVGETETSALTRERALPSCVLSRVLSTRPKLCRDRVVRRGTQMQGRESWTCPWHYLARHVAARADHTPETHNKMCSHACPER